MMGLFKQWTRVADRAFGGIALMVVHETTALKGHWTEFTERLEVARHARTPSQLVREQLDLIPESRSRLRHDQEIRRQLWAGLRRDLAAV